MQSVTVVGDVVIVLTLVGMLRWWSDGGDVVMVVW